MSKKLEAARLAWRIELTDNPLRSDGAHDKIDRFIAEDLVEAQDNKITELKATIKRWKFIATHERASMIGCGEGAAKRSPSNVKWLGDLYDEVHAEPKH